MKNSIIWSAVGNQWKPEEQSRGGSLMTSLMNVSVTFVGLSLNWGTGPQTDAARLWFPVCGTGPVQKYGVSITQAQYCQEVFLIPSSMFPCSSSYFKLVCEWCRVILIPNLAVSIIGELLCNIKVARERVLIFSTERSASWTQISPLQLWVSYELF